MVSSSEHFSTEASGLPTVKGRFVNLDSVPRVEFVPGLTFQPVLAQRTMTNFVSFEPHSRAPVHVHEEEQISIVIDGEFEFELDGEVRTMRRGDLVVIPSWVPHGAHTNDTTCYQIDVFNPPRRTLIEHADAQGVTVTDDNPV
jgi:quercetin dioxygenase-like cupin family protein